MNDWYFIYFRLLSRLLPDIEGKVEINQLYERFKFELMESTNNVTVYSKNCFIEHLKTLFQVERSCKRTSTEIDRTVLYMGVSMAPLCPLNDAITFDLNRICEYNIVTPAMTIKSKSSENVVLEMESGCFLNGNKVFKTLNLHRNGTFEISVGPVQINLDPLKIDSSYELNKTSVCTVLQIFKLIKICNGLKYNKTVTVSRFQTLETWTYNGESVRILRSMSCFRVVQLNSKTLTCRVCQKQCAGKENIKPGTKSETQTATENDIKRIFPNAPTEMVSMLLQQAKNVGRQPNGRRWSKEFAATCLQLYNRSPKSYELLSESKILILPSKSVLIMYKNALKQEPGFDPGVFEWMHEEALRLDMSENERIGGVIFDEMSI